MPPPIDTVEYAGEDRIRVRLACGHWYGPVHACSSTFDFPDDLLKCEDCGDFRYMDVGLMGHLLTCEEIEEAD